jgi:hypothetical protein
MDKSLEPVIEFSAACDGRAKWSSAWDEIG